MDLIFDSSRSINFPSEIMWLFLAGIIIFFFIMSFVLKHHWKYYGIKENPKVFAKAIYWVVSVFLILVMFLSIIYFENI